MLLYEEERLMKFEKWAPRALKGVLVGYDDYIIYWIYIKDQIKVIKVKNLCIFEDDKIKSPTKFPDYNDKSNFQGFFSEDNNKRSEELLSTYAEGQKFENTKGKQTFETNTHTEDVRATKSTFIISAHTKDARVPKSTSTIPACTKDARANLSTTTYSN